MKIEFRGTEPLAGILSGAAIKRGLTVVETGGELIVMCVHIEDHSHLSVLDAAMRWTVDTAPASVPIIVTSQVPPGWTRPWALEREHVFYQPHTIIAGREDECAFAPAAIVIGSADPAVSLPGAVEAYVAAYHAPLFRMTLESAEFAKIALNYLLASQIGAATLLAMTAEKVGADWSEIMPSLRLDERIGAHAYIRPGEAGGHLPRDVRTVERLSRLQ